MCSRATFIPKVAGTAGDQDIKEFNPSQPTPHPQKVCKWAKMLKYVQKYNTNLIEGVESYFIEKKNMLHWNNENIRTLYLQGVGWAWRM